MSGDMIYDPLKEFDSVLKRKVDEEIGKTFDELLKASGVNREKNRETVRKYNNVCSEEKAQAGKIRKRKSLRKLLFIIGVLSGGGSLLWLIVILVGDADKTIIPVFLLLMAIAAFVYSFIKLKPELEKLEAEYKNIEKERKRIYRKCLKETDAFHRHLDWNLASGIIRRAVPILSFDDYFDMKKLDLLQSEYGFLDDGDNHKSVELVLSGSLLDNPFLIVRNLCQTMGKKVYHGYLNISWVDEEIDSEGEIHQVVRTETLTASVIKPYPEYGRQTYLVYGNKAAPNLMFSRKPTHLKQPNEKELNRFIRKREKEIDRNAAKAIKKNLNFTPLANSKFEALWGGLDRNNEIEYRLLFTPLAQENEVKLITNNPYYGDDFYFRKHLSLNYVIGEHLQNFDLNQNPARFYSHDLDKTESMIHDYVGSFFQNIFFVLAPILSIPIYQQHKPGIFQNKDDYEQNYPNYETESLANSLPVEYFSPPDTVTENILKVTSVRKCGESDKVTIKAHAFYKEPRIDYIPVLGGDGYIHDVPVPWEEYLPAEQETIIAVRKFTDRKIDFDNVLPEVRKLFANAGSDKLIYAHGLLAFFTDESYNEDDDRKFDDILNNNKKEEA